MDTRSLVTSPPSYHSITGCTQLGPVDTSPVDSITNNGGFIAMVAGLSIVVPIVCVLVVQFRRAKMAERARMRAAPVASDIEADDPRIIDQPDPRIIEQPDPRIIDQPPTYEQMFGPNFHSFTTVVHPVHSRSFEVLIDENESAQHRNGSTDDQTEHGLAHVFRDQQPPGVINIADDTCDGQTCARSVRTNPHNSDSLIATISGSHIPEIASTSNVSQTSNGGSQSTIIPNTLQLATNNPPVWQPAPAHDVHLSPTMYHQDRTNNGGHMSPSDHSPQVPPRRHPGMHLSFEDFSPGGYQDNQTDSPPPSYEEAVHILETVELAKDRVY